MKHIALPDQQTQDSRGLTIELCFTDKFFTLFYYSIKVHLWIKGFFFPSEHSILTSFLEIINYKVVAKHIQKNMTASRWSKINTIWKSKSNGGRYSGHVIGFLYKINLCITWYLVSWSKIIVWDTPTITSYKVCIEINHNYLSFFFILDWPGQLTNMI